MRPVSACRLLPALFFTLGLLTFCPDIRAQEAAKAQTFNYSGTLQQDRNAHCDAGRRPLVYGDLRAQRYHVANTRLC